ncbi:hypothetical protein DKE52_008205 [Acinetobacter pittii]|uniref:Uncharacterized protein n=1 Tax=Acinetobacter pittii TaxID=48296 RepID=A0A3G6YKH8_ACIPI|nr:hypothetical protein DKE52_008205 [Acinetobacter pittii]
MQEFYDEISQGYITYEKTYGNKPDSIYMNPAKFADLFSWAAVTDFNIIDMTTPRKLLGMLLFTDRSFEFDFEFFEERDIQNALDQATNILEKYKPTDDLSRNEDSLTSYNTMETIQLNIPTNILSFRMRN